MNKREFLKLNAAVAGSLLLADTVRAQSAPAQASKVFRFVPQSDLKILDPIWTTAYVTRNHGFMVYDTLFGLDANRKIQPQMVDTWKASPDAKQWSFTLRSGLAFHDGKPVTSADVIASLQRWSKRDTFGQMMFSAMDTIEPKGADGFAMTFKTPFGLVLEALSKPSGVPAFIMPARVAATSADQQITDSTGSGPFILKKDEYRPGNKVVYLKNTAYKPRAEPPSGTAGGKHVYVDRVEWVILTDAQTQINAIETGSVDMVETMPSDFYASLKSNPKIELVDPTWQAFFTMHLNHLVKPFDNVKIAQAAMMAVNQQAVLRAQMQSPDLYETCPSIYSCDGPLKNLPTSYYTGKPQFAAAKALLKEAGYDGTPIVLLHPAEMTSLNKVTPVMAALLRQAGFTVDMVSMDWPTLVQRRASQAAPEQGGWNIYITSWGASDALNPLYFAPFNGRGKDGFLGWTTDPEMEKLKTEYVAATNDADRTRLAGEIQKRSFDDAIVAPLGEFTQKSIVRKGVISDVLSAPVNVLWNIKKT